MSYFVAFVIILCLLEAARRKRKYALTAHDWFLKGEASFEKNLYSKAIYCYTQAVELEPSMYEAWYKKGLVLEKKGNFDEAAVKMFGKAIEIKPEFAPAYKGMGDALKRLGRDAEAEEAFEKAEKLG